MADDWNITAWLAFARAIHFAACLLMMNVCVFDRFIAGGMDRPWQAIARRCIAIALPAALLSGILWFAFIAIDMSGLPPLQALSPKVLALVWNHTHFGALWRLRLFFWLLAATWTFPAFFRRRLSWGTLIFSSALVASLAFSGHGQTGPHRGLHLLADATHLLAAGCWPVGLLPFALVLFQARRRHPDCILLLTRRFSMMSIGGVCVLLATGLVNSYLLLGSISNILSTTYGRILLLKVGLFVVMVGIGVVNLLHLKPRLDGWRDPKQSAQWLQYNVTAELALLTAILIVVAILGLQAPAAM